MACAIVPLYPNDETPELESADGNATRWIEKAISNCLPRRAVRTNGLSTRNFAFGLMPMGWHKVQVAPTTPMSPATGSACPMFAFALPNPSESLSEWDWQEEGVRLPRAFSSPPVSVGSPSAVPVP